MNEIIAKLSNNSITDDHSAYYKYRGDDKNNQERRRLDLLKVQKEKRDNLYDNSRGILDLIAEEESRLHANPNRYTPKSHIPGFHKSNQLYYSNTLMFSEWMIDKPDDLATNWYALSCPKGKRILVVASNGKTKAYLKYGHLLTEWKSCLPGGNYQDSNNYCALDCVLANNQTIYVLDVLAWGNLSMTECEHDFRYFWLKSKFNETDYSVINNRNKKSIELIERFESSDEQLSKMLMKWPYYSNNDPAVDGILFYHKKAHYVKGFTPLVTWLFPYMINEVINQGIEIHSNYLGEKPSDYTNKDEYIQMFEERLSKKKQKVKKHMSYSFSSSNSGSPTSSLNNSTSSLESFGNGKVHFVFKGDEDEQENNKYANEMDTNPTNANMSSVPAQDVDVSVDSALGMMDDSISGKLDTEAMQ